MKNNVLRRGLLPVVFVFTLSAGYCQKGSLFIIGGGTRSPELIETLIKTANPAPNDYIVVLTMATSQAHESFESIRAQLSAHCKNVITGFNFTKDEANNNKNRIDSVRNAQLIYIVGGDQNKFMDVVRGSALYEAMHLAYKNGATISGTSAGAAVMSQIMITGAERDSTDKNNFKEIRNNNVITAFGMGFIKKAVIDQHFIRRSRYNRLLSVLADHPDKMVIGIDESTALIVKGNKVHVVGESQVVVISNPRRVKYGDNNKVSFKNAKLSILASGAHFKLK